MSKQVATHAQLQVTPCAGMPPQTATVQSPANYAPRHTATRESLVRCTWQVADQPSTCLAPPGTSPPPMQAHFNADSLGIMFWVKVQ